MQREAPDRVGGVLAGGGEFGRELVVGGEERGDVGAEGDPGGAGQGGGIEEKVGGSVGGLGEEVAKDEAALGVGVADLDGQAAPGGDDVEGAHGVAGDHVLDAADAEREAEGEVERHDGVGQAEHEGGAAHVLFHAEHAGSGFEVVAAAIESNALAAEPDVFGSGGGGAALPLEAGDDGRSGGAAADGGDGGVVFLQGGAFVAGRGGAVARGKGDGGVGEFGGAEEVGGRVDEIAGEPDGFCDRLGIGDGEGGELAFAGGQGVEAVGAEAEGEDGGVMVEITGLEVPGSGRQGGGEVAMGPERAVGAEADPGADEAVLARQQSELAGFGAEALGAEEGGGGGRESGEGRFEEVGAERREG